ncbi:MAG: hypothetical protein Q7J06_07910 [Bacteroidales bacterium]|nr:hypothetical protein [Bacteroidales bacterium]
MQSFINYHSGASGDATKKICGISEWQKELDGNFLIDYDTLYIIYDDHNKLMSGDWEDFKNDLIWHFNSDSP